MYGSRKCKLVRGNGAVASGNMEGKHDAEDGQMHDTIKMATNGPTGKKKRPRAVQDTS